MSFHLITQVWQLKLTPTQQHVLMALADYADDDGRNCFPSHPRLAWKTGYTTKTIQRTIPELIAIGLIIIMRPATNKAPPRYQLCLDMGQSKEPYCSEYADSRVDNLSTQDNSRVDNLSSQEVLGGHSDHSRVDNLSARVDTMSTDPIINLSYNQAGNENGPFPETAKEKGAEKSAEPPPPQTPPPPAETAAVWMTCVQELGMEHKTMGEWLQGSELLLTDQMENDLPLYRVLVVNPRHVEWIKQRCGRAIRWKLGGFFGKPVAIDIIAELTGVTS